MYPNKPDMDAHLEHGNKIHKLGSGRKRSGVL